MEEDDSAAELRHSMIRTLMPNTLGALWVREHCSFSLRREIQAMVDRIRDAAIRCVETTSWMAPSTRAAAVTKLRKMDVQLCWPETWEPEEVPSQVFLENFISLSARATDRNIALLVSGSCRHPVSKGWARPVYDVNAYYYPDENRFVLPAAILRPPYYDRAKSIPWNYGAIGATIGHELCHAFDADGRYHDATGDKHAWWTRGDDREYKQRARRVTALYESRQYRGMDVDGSLTLTENIADLGGLEFGIAGAAAALGRPLTKAEKREFFTSFAVSWRAKDRKRRAAELLVTDVHAPPRLRVNHAVRQMDEWYEAFDITPDCADYIPPGKRIHFFR
jgi:endothelin-converting enzyme/putative endopeptidase